MARRSLDCPEGNTRLEECTLGSRIQGDCCLPAKNRVKHVVTLWGRVLGQLRPALAAQHPLGKPGGRRDPAQAAVRAEARGMA